MPKSRHREVELAEYEHFEWTSPDNPARLVALANVYDEVDRQED
jgi:hypothetical protein